MRRWAEPVLALAIVTACGGAASDTTTTSIPTTTEPTTTTTTTSTTTSTTTTTTTLPPTTTTTRPAIPVTGWAGEGIREISVVIEADFPTLELEGEARTALEMVGVDVTNGSDVVFLAVLDGTPRSATYGELGICYTGATITGSIEIRGRDLTGSDVVEVRGDVPVPFAVFSSSCTDDPDEAPFEQAFPIALQDALVRLFGPGAIPYLSHTVSRTMYGNWESWLGLRRNAIVEYRAMGPESLPVETQYAFLSATLTGLEMVLESEDDDLPPYVEAARQLLVSYSSEDFGLENEADLVEWRSWLTAWYAEQSG
jgi:hypothetical protein